jgi:SAM-dependent methyltransferase
MQSFFRAEKRPKLRHEATDAAATTFSCGRVSGVRHGTPPATFPDLLERIYPSVVSDPKSLGKNAKNFTHEVYGEALPPLIAHILAQTSFPPKGGTFVDVGSGVGQVVLQVAYDFACTLAVGIELMPHRCVVAARLAQRVVDDAHSRGAALSPLDLRCGDFRFDDTTLAAVRAADVIFVNNKAFEPEANLALAATVVRAMRPGAKVVTFVALVGKRGRGSAAGLLRLLEVVRFEGGGVSWTSSGIDYFVHERTRTPPPPP